MMLAAGGAGAGGHHSIAAVYDGNARMTLDGVVVEFRLVNPHAFLTIHTGSAERVELWKLELDNRAELASIGMTAETLKTGDRLIVSGSRAHDGSRSLYAWRLDRPADGFWYEQVGSTPRIGFRRDR